MKTGKINKIWIENLDFCNYLSTFIAEIQPTLSLFAPNKMPKHLLNNSKIISKQSRTEYDFLDPHDCKSMDANLVEKIDFQGNFHALQFMEFMGWFMEFCELYELLKVHGATCPYSYSRVHGEINIHIHEFIAMAIFIFTGSWIFNK